MQKQTSAPMSSAALRRVKYKAIGNYHSEKMVTAKDSPEAHVHKKNTMPAFLRSKLPKFKDRLGNSALARAMPFAKPAEPKAEEMKAAQESLRSLLKKDTGATGGPELEKEVVQTLQTTLKDLRSMEIRDIAAIEETNSNLHYVLFMLRSVNSSDRVFIAGKIAGRYERDYQDGEREAQFEAQDAKHVMAQLMLRSMNLQAGDGEKHVFLMAMQKVMEEPRESIPESVRLFMRAMAEEENAFVDSAVERLKSQQMQEKLAAVDALGKIASWDGFMPLLRAVSKENDSDAKAKMLSAMFKMAGNAPQKLPDNEMQLRPLRTIIMTDAGEAAVEAVRVYSEAVNAPEASSYFKSLRADQGTEKAAKNPKIYEEIVNLYYLDKA
jgi:hypothetical protein